MKILLGFVVLLGLGAGGFWFGYVVPREAQLSAPGARAEDLNVDVPSGSTQKQVFAQLAKQGIVQDSRFLYYYARYKKLGAPKAGEFRLEKTLSVLQILDKMHRGEVVQHELSFPEGLTYKEIAQRLNGDMISAQALIQLCEDQAFLREHKVPGKTCEGYLFPDTYRFAKGLTPRDIVGMFINHFHEMYAANIKQIPTKLTPAEVVILGSIIEKETGSAAERGHIASVFVNRLAQRIPLATDPTVIYAVTLARGSFDGNIRKADLQLDHPYNTYKKVGLPPGPISNPGIAALTAAVKPQDTKDIFFVSRNDGTSVFCPTLACHEAAVQKWQVEYFRKKKKK